MNAATTPTVSTFALSLTRTHTYRVCVSFDDLGNHVMADRTETWNAGAYEFLICGEQAFVSGWTKTGSRGYECVRYWTAMPVAAARKMARDLRGEGYEWTESKTRVLGFIAFAGGNVWHSWGEGANRVGHCNAAAQIVPVIVGCREQILRLTALSPEGDYVRVGDVAINPWYSYDAARSLVAGEWTLTDSMVSVDSVNDCRAYELNVH